MEKVKLGDIFNITSGGTPSRKNDEYYINGNIKWVKTGDLKKKYIESTEEYITEKGLENSSARMYGDGTVLIAMYGATIGAVSILKTEACTNQACAAFVKNEKVIPEYLYYFLRSRKNKFINDAFGGAQPNISAGYLKNIFFNLIDLKEQKNIVDKMNIIEEIIDIRKKQIEELNQLIKSLFVEMFGNIKETVELSYYSNGLSAGKSLAGEQECINKVLKTGSVSYDYFDKTEIKNLPITYTPNENHLVKKGDVIISRMNTAELVGACGYVWENIENTYYPDRLWKMNLKENCNPIFIWQSIIQQEFKNKIKLICSGTSGSMKNISQEKFLKLKIKLVEIEKQNQFANIVEQIDKQKFEIQKSLEEVKKLQESLMNKYFG